MKMRKVNKTAELVTVLLAAVMVTWNMAGPVMSEDRNPLDKRRCDSYSRNGNLSSCRLTGADMAYLDLTDCIMARADLRGANLSGAYMVSANIHGADLSGAYLGIAVLDYAVLEDASFRGAYLGGASLWNANLSNADLSGADLSNANLRYAVLDHTNLDMVVWNNTTCPDGSNSDEPDGDDFTCFYNIQ